MKLETMVIITKGACLAYIPLGTTLAAGLPDLGLETLFGVPIKGVTLACAATVAGAGGLLAFLTQSFGNYMAGRKSNGNTEFLVKPPTP